MTNVIISVSDFDDWRKNARLCLIQHFMPNTVDWQEAGQVQSSLFCNQINSLKLMLDQPTEPIKITKAFIDMAKIVACHRNPQKWALLYNVLWNLVYGQKHILKIATHPIMHEIYNMKKSVGRDMHKMKAFVRFEKILIESQEYYISWYKPQHNIIKAVAPFFQNRFRIMQWTIMTPDGSAKWDGKKLSFFDTKINDIKNKSNDSTVELWKTYYSATFNPARIKIKAMLREMPRRYWETMPETQMITSILNDAPKRVNNMLSHSEGSLISANNYLPEEKTYHSLLESAKECQGCPLYKSANQTVFGHGNIDAEIMFVGEQPGYTEDNIGKPFVGPAGNVLMKALEELNLDRKQFYYTNAVKHFKFKSVNNKKLHVSPNTKEIVACKPWLTSEIAIVKPKLILCLGITASRAVLGYGFNIKLNRGRIVNYNDSIKAIATYHPSSILRATDQLQKDILYKEMIGAIYNAVNNALL
jgi:probable DNA metabolism protein